MIAAARRAMTTAGVGLLCAVSAAPAPARAADPAACAPWAMKTVASGLGSLENLEPDGRGGMLVSASNQSAIARVAPDGKASVLVPEVKSPGGLRVRGGTLWFNTGAAAANGAAGQGDGTIEQADVVTGARTLWARGLTMPNGLVFLPNGDAVVSRDVGQGTGVTRVPAADPADPQFSWADLPDTNGLAVDPTGTWLYAVETFTLDSTVYRIRIADPRVVEVVAKLGGARVPKGLDDMTIDGDGILYITANGAGEVIRLDPRDGASCVIASGLRNPSAVKFGRGPGWPATHLFVSGFDGNVRELTPPAGVAPPPAVEHGAPTAQAPGPAPGPGPSVTPPAKLRVTASPRRLRTRRGRTCVRFRVRSGGRPVAGAVIRFAGRRARTGSSGRARICRRFRVTMLHRARVAAPGFRRGQAAVRVRRRAGGRATRAGRRT